MYWAVGVLVLGAEILVGVKVLFPDIIFGIRSSIEELLDNFDNSAPPAPITDD